MIEVVRTVGKRLGRCSDEKLDCHSLITVQPCKAQSPCCGCGQRTTSKNNGLAAQLLGHGEDRCDGIFFESCIDSSGGKQGLKKIYSITVTAFESRASAGLHE